MSTVKTYDALLTEMLATLRTETGIDHVEEDGVARTFAELLATELAELWRVFDEREEQQRFSTASGMGLDDWGQALGTARKLNRAAASSSRGMKFYCDAPAPDGGYTIAAGTLVWSPANAADYFITTDTVTIPAGGTVALTGIRAPFAGDSSAGAYTLTIHNGPPAVKCTNLEALAGSTAEGDEQYRYRLEGARAGRNALLADAIRKKLLGYPGVFDCRVFPCRRGNGTLDLLVYTEEALPTAETLTAISAYARGLVADGVTVSVRAPEPVIVDLSLRLAFAPAVSAADAEQLRQTAQRALLEYLNTRDLGEAIYPDRLEYQVLQLSQTILDVAITEMRVNGITRAVGAVTADEYQRIVAGRLYVA